LRFQLSIFLELFVPPPPVAVFPGPSAFRSWSLRFLFPLWLSSFLSPVIVRIFSISCPLSAIFPRLSRSRFFGRHHPLPLTASLNSPTPFCQDYLRLRSRHQFRGRAETLSLPFFSPPPQVRRTHPFTCDTGRSCPQGYPFFYLGLFGPFLSRHNPPGRSLFPFSSRANHGTCFIPGKQPFLSNFRFVLFCVSPPDTANTRAPRLFFPSLA